VPRGLIIGGGAAGLLAAGRAAELRAEAVVIERGPALARKLRISGKGRGNITNTAEMKEFIAAFGPNGKFLYGAFYRFFRDDLLQLLKRLGVATKVERGGRVFPASDKAEDVAAALEKWILRLGVTIKYNTRVKEILVEDGRAVGVNTYSGPIRADRVILATGGISYPKTGSTGDGYAMAAAVGHEVIPPRPSLSALVAQEAWVKRLQGLSLRNVKATLSVSSPGPGRSSDAGPQGPGLRARKIAEEFGEMVFTHFGVSGPIILTLSRHAPEALKQGEVTLSINLKPALTEEQLDQRLVRDFIQKKHFANYLPDLLPRSLIPVFVEMTGIPGDTPVNKITSVERKAIVALLQDFRLTIREARPVDEAIVTAGGVSIKEIDPRTMESKLVKGLYFAGEVIDIDAITGGYNLQAAFSTGWVAGDGLGCRVIDVG
jgi:predicted Rossmann fold flavoprotein